jgi:hypothetical protein
MRLAPTALATAAFTQAAPELFDITAETLSHVPVDSKSKPMKMNLHTLLSGTFTVAALIKEF